MFKSTKEFDQAVYEILIRIRDESEYKTPTGNIDKFDHGDAIDECIKRRYVIGLEGDRTMDGLFHPHGNARITREGLNFIERFDR